MISQLTIQNFGLIDHLCLEFHAGLNIFTGETGAGKSILIDAIRFSLGERITHSILRDTARPCIVEIVIELPDHFLQEHPLFLEYLPDHESILILTRTYLPDGRTKNKINGFTVTLSQMKEIGNLLIDLHGPHDHQMLLAETSHITILDRLCDSAALLNAYREQYSRYLHLQNQLRELQDMALSRERELDMLQYQIRELEQVSLEQNSYDTLLHDRARVNNAEKLFEAVQELLYLLDHDQTSISTLISKSFIPMHKLNAVDDSTARHTETLARVQEDLSELIHALKIYSDTLSFEPHETEEINRLYNAYYDILHKYGPDVETAKDFYNKALDRYTCLSNLEHTDAVLQEQIAEIKTELEQLAQQITKKRKKTGKALEETIEAELKELGIPAIQFECRITKTDLHTKGCDAVIFYISPNAGEALKPLAQIVSSGEAARVMLALKKALTYADPIPVLIFDEIDAQIGGRLGSITGKKLKELSKNRQVILITHLPQIASFADAHFKVVKQVKNNRTSTDAQLLSKDEKIEELAHMMSGQEEDAIALKHADQMLKKART